MGMFDFGFAPGAASLSPQDRVGMRRAMMLSLGARLLQGSGWSPQRTTLGQQLGAGLGGLMDTQQDYISGIQANRLYEQNQEKYRLEQERLRAQRQLGQIPQTLGLLGSESGTSPDVLASQIESAQRAVFGKAYPEQYGDELGKRLFPEPAAPPEPYSLSPGEQRYPGLGGTPIAENKNPRTPLATATATASPAIDSTNTKLLDEALAAADTARNQMNEADQMMGFLDANLGTGAARPIGATVAAWAESLGLGKWDENLPMAQAFEAMSNVSALRLRNPAGGLGLGGSTSNEDRNFLKESVAGLGKTKEANYILLIVMRANARRAAELADMKAMFISQHGGLAGFPEARRDFIENNSVFTPEEKEAIQTYSRQGAAALGGASPQTLTNEQLLQELQGAQ